MSLSIVWFSITADWWIVFEMFKKMFRERGGAWSPFVFNPLGTGRSFCRILLVIEIRQFRSDLAVAFGSGSQELMLMEFRIICADAPYISFRGWNITFMAGLSPYGQGFGTIFLSTKRRSNSQISRPYFFQAFIIVVHAKTFTFISIASRWWIFSCIHKTIERPDLGDFGSCLLYLQCSMWNDLYWDLYMI